LTFNNFARRSKEDVYDPKRRCTIRIIQTYDAVLHVKVVVHTTHFVSLVVLLKGLVHLAPMSFLFGGDWMTMSVRMLLELLHQESMKVTYKIKAP